MSYCNLLFFELGIFADSEQNDHGWTFMTYLMMMMMSKFTKTSAASGIPDFHRRFQNSSEIFVID